MLNLMSRCVAFALMAVAVGPMIVLTNRTPDDIPANVTAAEQEKQIDGVSMRGQPAPVVVGEKV